MLSVVHTVVVYLSVCLSVTIRYCVKTAKCRITQIMPYGAWDSNFQMGCFVVAEFLLTNASRGPSSAIAARPICYHLWRG